MTQVRVIQVRRSNPLSLPGDAQNLKVPGVCNPPNTPGSREDRRVGPLFAGRRFSPFEEPAAASLRLCLRWLTLCPFGLQAESALERIWPSRETETFRESIYLLDSQMSRLGLTARNTVYPRDCAVILYAVIFLIIASVTRVNYESLPIEAAKLLLLCEFCQNLASHSRKTPFAHTGGHPSFSYRALDDGKAHAHRDASRFLVLRRHDGRDSRPRTHPRRLFDKSSLEELSLRLVKKRPLSLGLPGKCGKSDRFVSTGTGAIRAVIERN